MEKGTKSALSDSSYHNSDLRIRKKKKEKKKKQKKQKRNPQKRFTGYPSTITSFAVSATSKGRKKGKDLLKGSIQGW